MAAALSLQEVSLSRGESTLLDSITWQAAEGEHWAILGQNGSGKTLLLRIISGYLWPTSGSVEVLGRRFGSFDLRELRKQIGWVSLSLQFEVPPAASALEVVQSGFFASLGLYESIEEKQRRAALELLKEFECEQLADHPFGRLSYGEQKRVLIARALVHEPKLLILDEPCTGLDLRSREAFLGALDQLLKRRDSITLLFVTHHVEEILPSIENALLLRAGKVMAHGKVGEIVTSENISSCFDFQAEIARDQFGRFWLSRA